MRLPRLTVLLLAAPLVLAGCGEKGQPGTLSPEPGRAAAWERLPAAPLSPRGGPVTVWTGSEVLVLGGETGDACPPNADCAVANEMATDGAALDPAAGTWRPIAPAPVPVPADTPAALVDGHVYLRVGTRVLDYDVSGDRWQVLGRALTEWYTVQADGHRLLLVSGTDEGGERPDLTYEPATGRWAELPADPWGPMFDRGLIATPGGVLLVGHELTESPGGGDQPSYVLAALLDRRTGRWTKLPPSNQLGAGEWAAIGSRVVNVSLDSTDGGGGGGGGAGDYGRRVRYGGVLDLGTRSWSPLPHPPKYLTGGWSVAAAGTRLIAAEGWIYDDEAKTWTMVPRPAGGADRPGPAVWAGDRLIVIGGTNQTNDNRTARDGSVWSGAALTGNRL